MNVVPAKSLRGTADLPGDKSISHRAALIAAMAEGETRIQNFSGAKDCQTTLECLSDLGVIITRQNDIVSVKGVGKDGFQKPENPLDCGNSGTTMRLLAGILAGQNFESTLVGDESLRKRPMHRVAYPIKKMGARVQTTHSRSPLTIYGKQPLRSIEYAQMTPSAQIKSCILLAGLNAEGETSVIEPSQTRDHTERMLGWFGAEIKNEKNKDRTRIAISGSSKLTARDVKIPGDISSAAFFLVAAACLSDSDLTLENVGVNPTRTAILDLLTGLGAKIELLAVSEICREPVGTIRLRGGLRKCGSKLILDGQMVAGLIDELPIIAVLGTQLEHGIEVRGAAELRIKETDRIAAITENLGRMNADVSEFEDGFKVARSQLKGAVIDSFGDHRIAMAFAIAGLLAEEETEIIGADSADISFPGFFEILSAVVA